MKNLFNRFFAIFNLEVKSKDPEKTKRGPSEIDQGGQGQRKPDLRSVRRPQEKIFKILTQGPWTEETGFYGQ